MSTSKPLEDFIGKPVIDGEELRKLIKGDAPSEVISKYVTGDIEHYQVRRLKLSGAVPCRAHPYKQK